MNSLGRSNISYLFIGVWARNGEAQPTASGRVTAGSPCIVSVLGMCCCTRGCGLACLIFNSFVEKLYQCYTELLSQGSGTGETHKGKAVSPVLSSREII